MNYFFLDASAISKRYFIEIGSDVVNYLFNTVPKERMIMLIIAIGEVISVLVRRRNSKQISEISYRQAVVEFHAEMINETGIMVQSISNDLIWSSLSFIEKYSLNATDAIILCCALDLTKEIRNSDDDLVFITADTRLYNAAQSSGLNVWNPERDGQVSLDLLI